MERLPTQMIGAADAGGQPLHYPESLVRSKWFYGYTARTDQNPVAGSLTATISMQRRELAA
jgi:hypothetical protein